MSWKKHRSVRKGVGGRAGKMPPIPGEALRAPVGMKDQWETTAPSGVRRGSVGTVTNAEHLGATVGHTEGCLDV